LKWWPAYRTPVTLITADADFDGNAYLLPGRYTNASSKELMVNSAVPLRMLTSALRAKGLNLFLYGACRNDPVAES
jgi:hypothetical protein